MKIWPKVIFSALTLVCAIFSYFNFTLAETDKKYIWYEPKELISFNQIGEKYFKFKWVVDPESLFYIETTSWRRVKRTTVENYGVIYNMDSEISLLFNFWENSPYNEDSEDLVYVDLIWVIDFISPVERSDYGHLLSKDVHYKFTKKAVPTKESVHDEIMMGYVAAALSFVFCILAVVFIKKAIVERRERKGEVTNLEEKEVI